MTQTFSVAVSLQENASRKRAKWRRVVEEGIKSHYPKGAILAPAGLYSVSRIFPRPCVRAGFRSALPKSQNIQGVMCVFRLVG